MIKNGCAKREVIYSSEGVRDNLQLSYVSQVIDFCFIYAFACLNCISRFFLNVLPFLLVLETMSIKRTAVSDADIV